jgi:hypothetical protein
MAESENKNQHTLYRFVSLRNPELSKKKDQNKRFVFYNEPQDGFFISKTLPLAINETKWAKLIATATNFESSTKCIKTQADFTGLNYVTKEFLEYANWLSSNRSNFLPDVFLKEVGSKFKSLDEKTVEKDLWDNLFYQVVTQKDFYIKETIMHLLVFNNLLKEIQKLASDVEKIDFLPSLANARVVLPTSLFELESNLPEGSFAKNANASEPTFEEVQETNRQKATENSIALQKASKEITKLIQKHAKESRIAYQTAQVAYEALVAPIKSKFQQEITEAKSKLTPAELEKFDPNDRSNKLNAQPTIPAFEFEFTQKVDDKYLEKSLSSESFEILKNCDALKDNENYSDLLQKANEAFINEQRIIVKNTNFSIPVVIIGGHAVYPSNKKGALSRGKETKVTSAFVPEKFGVRNIGIADYKKVVSHVCCYKAGEVSHIENIMAKELRSKTTTVEHIEEFTQTTEKQSEKENSTDNSTTQRFEMQSEVSKLLAEDRQFESYANYTYDGKMISGKIEIGANYATNNSKEQSNRQAVTQAKEITNRAMERIVTKVRTETVRKTTDRFTEQNIHDFDNRKGETHVSGVYRFINSIYQNQIYNYGKRMMYEFMIPEPSMLHRSGMTITDGIINTPKIPKDPATLENPIRNYLDINEGNYLELCTSYQAQPIPYPQSSVQEINVMQEQDGVAVTGQKEWGLNINIPEGKKIDSLTGTITFDRRGEFDSPPWWATTPQSIADWNPHKNTNGYANIGGLQQNFGDVRYYNPSFTFTNEILNNAGLYLWTWDIGRLYFSLNANFSASNAVYLTWQTDTYNAIMTGYQKQLDAYNLLLENAGTVTVKNIATNSGFYRQIEQLILRKECIAYIMDETKMGQSFYGFNDPKNVAPNNKTIDNFYIKQSQEMDSYASFVKFMEQAFEWDIMSYNFYPFYWGAREDWAQLYQYECNDPLFRSFMQAGMARVVVTVKPGFENAVLHYMTTGQIWNGGEVPVLGNPLYLSIVDEIREQEYTVEETWETVVPTSLIGIQESGVSIKGTGLPCDPECKDHADITIENNPVKLKSVIGEATVPIK